MKKNIVIKKIETLTLELTNLCNLQCIICPRQSANGRKMNYGNMNIEEAKKVIDEYYQSLQAVNLTDLGETLLYPQLAEIIDYIKNKNSKISISFATNATLPNAPEIIKPLANKINNILISVDGVNKIYESIRRKSNYMTFVKNVKAISILKKHHNFTFTFNMVVFKKNYQQMTDVVRLAKRFDVAYLQINPLNIIANSKWSMSFYNFYFSKKFQEKLSKATQLAKRLGVNLGSPIFADLNNPKTIRDCPYIWDGFTVSWDGYLPLCCGTNLPKEKNFGNVFEKGLLNCINNKELKNIRKAALKGKAPKYCRGCYFLTDEIIKNYWSTKAQKTQ